MRTEPISLGYLHFRGVNEIEGDNKEKAQVATQPRETNLPPKKNALPLITAAVAITSLGVSAYALKGRARNKALEESKRLAEEAKAKAEQMAEEAKKAAQEETAKLKEEINKLNQKVGDTEATLKEKQQWNEGYLNSLNERVEQSKNPQVIVQTSQTRHLHDIDGLSLIQYVDNDGKKINLPTAVTDKLKTTATRFMTGKKADGSALAVAALGAGSVVYLPTAESIPEKEGGLGEVPVQIARNLDNEFGVTNYILRPLNEIPGKSTLIEREGRYYYWFDKMKNADGQAIKEMEVQKVVTFPVQTVRNGQTEIHNVEVYYGTDPATGYKRIMFRDPIYFGGAKGLYKESETATETEREAFFAKVVYEFSKLKADPKSKTSYQIHNQSAFDSIKAPDAMVLNDWHTAPIAALMRLLAPVEAENKELNSDVAKLFENMNLMYIVHNSDYQGWGGQRSSDILNTLFGKYAFDIYKHAETGFTEIVKDGEGEDKVQPIESLRKVLTINGTVNLANMGMTLATKVKPVSPTYAQEIAAEPERGQAIMHVAEFRLQAGTMQGQSNGWDRSVNEMSKSKINEFANMFNNDKFEIFRYTIKHIKGLTEEQTRRINEIMKKNIGAKNYADIIDDLRKLDIQVLTDTLHQLKEKGITELRTLKPATADMDMNDIIAARRHNKQMLIESLISMIEFNKAKEQEIAQSGEKNVFNLVEYGITDLSDIDLNKLDEIPLFNMGVRFVSQKGVNIAAGAWEEILNKWDDLFPGRPRPIIITGGEDAEGGKHCATVRATKQRLGMLGRHWMHTDSFTPNPFWMAGADWTMRPSYFEPDGDKWESLYKGTPAVLTRTGGHVDSVQDGFNGILTKRTMKQIRDELKSRGLSGEQLDKELTKELIKDYKEALIRTLNVFFGLNGEKPQSQYVNNAIHGDQSWVIRDKNGKIIKCPCVEHMRDLGFDLSQFPQIAESVYTK